MDSSASNAVANNKDVPSSMTPTAVEDDGAMSVNSGLAKEAALFFQSGNYADCVRVLYQLLQKKEGDPKVLHNIAIAVNFQDGCSNPKKLIDELNNAKKRSEELACAAGDQADPASNVGAKAVTGISGNNSAPRHLSAQHSSELVYADEFDPSVTTYNLAVCWFHLHEHAKAFSILEGLFQNIEPIDEEIAKRICLLLLDVALLARNAARSADVISYVEKVFCSSSLLSQVDSGNSALPTASAVLKSASFPSNSTIPDASTPDSPAAGITSEGSLSRTLSEEGLEDLHLISSMEIGGQNLPRQSGLKSSNTTIKMVEQSRVLNTPGAERQTKRELFDALRQELETSVLEKASKSVWELILDNKGIGKEISETVEQVFCRLSGREAPLFVSDFGPQPEKGKEKKSGQKEENSETGKNNSESAAKKRKMNTEEEFDEAVCKSSENHPRRMILVKCCHLV